MAASHSDAHGYLAALAKEFNKQWFRFLCDSVIAQGLTSANLPTRDAILALFLERASYLGMPTGTAIAPSPRPATSNASTAA